MGEKVRKGGREGKGGDEIFMIFFFFFFTYH